MRSRRFEVLRCLHFVDVTRISHTMPGVVSFSILRPIRCSAQVKWLANAQGGSRLHLDTDLDLDETFGDPCPGMRKKLVIRYYVRGFHGCTRVDEDPMDYLSTDIQIGYLPTADDPFGAKPPRNATQIAVDEIQKLRMVDATGRSTEVKEGKYTHLGRAW